jgi:hypothetical protein
MPAAQEIMPTQFAKWNHQFFADPESTSLTRVYNDRSFHGIRYAYGVSSDSSSFFIQMNVEQEVTFWQLFIPRPDDRDPWPLDQ